MNSEAPHHPSPDPGLGGAAWCHTAGRDELLSIGWCYPVRVGLSAQGEDREDTGVAEGRRLGFTEGGGRKGARAAGREENLRATFRATIALP